MKNLLSIILSLLFSAFAFSQNNRIFSDEFTGNIINPDWIIISPNPASTIGQPGNGNLILDASPLNGGSGYSPLDNYDMIRIFQPVFGNWEIEIKFAFSPNNNYQGAGIFLQEDSILQDTAGLRVSERAFFPLEGGNVIRSIGTYDLFNSQISFLRIRKMGETYTGWYSSDGVNWVLNGTSKGPSCIRYAGVFAIRVPWDNDLNISSIVELDYFRIKRLITAKANPKSNFPFCLGDSLKLFADSIPGASYFWEGPNGFLSQEQNPIIPDVSENQSGLYSVRYSINGCSESPKEQIEVTISSCTSFIKVIGDTLDDFASSVIPNHTGGNIILANTYSTNRNDQDILLMNLDIQDVLTTKKVFGAPGKLDQGAQIFPTSNGYGIIGKGENDLAGSTYRELAFGVDSSLSSVDWVKSYYKFTDSSNLGNLNAALSLRDTIIAVGSSRNTNNGFSAGDLTFYMLDASSGDILTYNAYNGSENQDDSYLALTFSQDSNSVYAVGSTVINSSTLTPILSKFDRNGNLIYHKRYNHPNSRGAFASVLALPSDSLLILATKTADTGDQRIGNFLTKTDSDGNIGWTKRIEINADSNLVFNKMKWINQSLWLSGVTSSTGGNSKDIVLVNSDSSLNINWAKVYGGIDDESIGDFTIQKDGSIYMVGGTNSFAGNAQDILILKTDPYGNINNISSSNYSCFSVSDVSIGISSTTLVAELFTTVNVGVLEAAHSYMISNDSLSSYDCFSTGIEEKLMLNSLIIGPNPFFDYFSLDFDLTTFASVKIQLVDLSGKLLYEKRKNNEFIGNHKYTLNTSQLPPGAYLCQVIIDNHLIQTFKLLKF